MKDPEVFFTRFINRIFSVWSVCFVMIRTHFNELNVEACI